MINGILLLHKPRGFTSHDAVAKMRSLLDQKAVGHTGTLDPLAEGLLLICMGRATKIARWLTDMDKEYEAVIRLGLESPTFDAEGLDPETLVKDVSHIDRQRVQAVLDDLTGIIEQQVPPYAAVKVGGKKLYEQARKGREVSTPVRQVHINELELLEFDSPDVRIRVACSKGTYIRSLAHDIGQKLNCGAYLEKLVRTRIGRHSLNDATTFETLKKALDAGTGDLPGLLAIDEVLPLSGIRISEEFAQRVIQGPPLRAVDILGVDGAFSAGDEIFLRDPSGGVVAVGTAERNSSELTNASHPTDRQTVFAYSRVLN